MKIKLVFFLLLAGVALLIVYLLDRNNRQWEVVKRRATQNMLAGAAGSGDLKTMQTCLDAGATVNDVPTIVSPLQMAAFYHQEEAVRFLLDHGANPNGTGSSSPLFSVGQGWGVREVPARLPIAKLLIERGADPNVHDVLGQTPLSRAKASEDADLALLLQQHGAHD